MNESSLPLPEGYRRYIVISKEPPKIKSKKKENHIVHKEVDNDVLLLRESFEQLHKEIHKLANEKREVHCSECCNGSIFDCFKFKGKVKVTEPVIKIT